MTQVEAGVAVPIEVSYETGLAVAMRVYDVTGVPILVDTVEMDEVAAGTYYALFIFDPNKLYVVKKNVYTDGTFTIVDNNYGTGSESFRTTTIEQMVQQIIPLIPSLSPPDITGIVDDMDLVVGSIEDGG